MLSVIIIFYIVQLIIALVLWLGKKKCRSYEPLKEYENISVIIPFKNEQERIDNLIHSINQSAIAFKNSNLFKHLDFIFVDDHSIDDSVDKILNHLDIKFRLYKLNQTSGKKYAIKQGVHLAKYEKILTLDADVNFEVDFLNHISKTKCEGLTILPVKMSGKTFLQQLFSIEFDFLQTLTFGLAGLKKPLLCNGANLLFTKSAFLNSLKVRTDADILSGDDVFLLQACHTQGESISAINSNKLSVNTAAPKDLKSLLNQRLRWAKKMKNTTSIFGGLFLLTSNALFIMSIILSFNNSLFLIPILIKLISELLAVVNPKNQRHILVHQIWYPFYLTLIILNFGRQPKWK